MIMKSNDKKNFIWNSIGSTVNSLTSLFFMIIVTRLNGIDSAGVFTFAFSFAIFAQVIGNYFGRSYQVTNIDDDIKDSDFVYSRIFTCILMALFSFAFVFFKNYTNYKVLIILLLVLFRMIESYGEVLYGIVQKGNNLYKVGISMFFKALFSVLLFFCFDYFWNNLYLAILSISLVNLLIIIFYDYKNVKKLGFSFYRFNKSSFRKILFDGFLIFLFTFLTQYVLNASKYSIDDLLTDSFQTIYGIIVMPATVMVLCAQFLVQPFLTRFAKYLKEKKFSNFSQLVFKLCLYVFIFGILATVFCYFFGIPILEFIYGLELHDYINSLLLIIGASTFFGISYVFSNVLITLRKNFIQVIIYGFVALVAFFLSNLFVRSYGVFGACLSYFISMFILAILYFVVCVYYLKRIVKNYDYSIHTFVILAYKESPFLEECIKSVLNQSVKSNAIIATTTRNDYIDGLANKYHLDIVEGVHTSIGGDFDFAISAGKTKLVTIAHQDDLYDFNYAEEVVKNYYNNRNCLIIFSDYYEIRKNTFVYSNKNLFIKRFLLFSLLIKKTSGIKFLKRNVLRLGCSICCPAVTFVTENIPSSVFECNMKCDVDWFAWEKLSKLNGKFIYIPKNLVGHRIDETTTTTDIINQGIRTKEDLIMLKKFWPDFIARAINKLYKNSENSNKLE